MSGQYDQQRNRINLERQESGVSIKEAHEDRTSDELLQRPLLAVSSVRALFCLVPMDFAGWRKFSIFQRQGVA